jgi:hypothetical protein
MVIGGRSPPVPLVDLHVKVHVTVASMARKVGWLTTAGSPAGWARRNNRVGEVAL